MIPRKYYEVTDGDDHVGYVSEEYTMKKFDEKFLTGKAECNFLIGKYEAIDVEPVRHGHWEYIGGYGYQYRCSECVMCAERTSNYCPNCGSKMDEVKDE